jgi:Spy/CpxP family protein refolding chaperone
MKKYGHLSIAIFFLVIFFSFGPDLMAQGPRCEGMMRQEQEAKNLENLRLLKLLEVLDLNDEQSKNFISLFVDFRKEIRQIMDGMQKEIDSLADLVQADKPSEDKIRAEISKIEVLKQKREEAARKFQSDISKILSAVQMGKVVVFEERFDRKLIETMRCFRTGQMPPPDTL